MKSNGNKTEFNDFDLANIELTDLSAGLNSAQVSVSAQKYGTNAGAEAKTKSVAAIFKENLLTFFNILNAVLAGLLIFAGAYSDLAFMLVIISNLAIGLFQELKAKRTLDKLSLLTMGKITVIRDGKKSKISDSQIVKGDIIIIKSGDQVPCDCLIRRGSFEVNESLVSGESDDILKKEGDFLYSGSIAVAGEVWAQAVRVGADSFSGRMSTEAKTDKKTPSKIRAGVRKILKIISVIVIPIGAATFARQYVIGEMSAKENIVRTVASMIGMIPEGLFLITSIALCAGAIILAYKKTLVQNMYAIEALSYADILCLDKTGTLTLGAMTVDSVESLDRSADVKKLLSYLTYALGGGNATMAAISKKFAPIENKSLLKTVPFSSSRKYSAACFADCGSVVLGAFEFLFDKEDSRHNDARTLHLRLTKGGKRVLTLAVSRNNIESGKLPEDLNPVAFVVISDKIKPSAKKTIEYFYSQGVDIKIISGDNPKTVSEIAEMCGVKNAQDYIDASGFKAEEELFANLDRTVFGAVTPEQKKKIIAALKKEGHTVAMTGDGVNDMAALREADCSVAMASGAQAACNVSTMVLLNSDFDSMPAIVNEGRKAVNNLQRSAALFITKTIYALLAALMSMTFLEYGYPYTPLQLTVMSFATIGFPAFFLAFEPNYSPIKGSFLNNVFARSLPGGICAAIGITACDLYGKLTGANYGEVSSLCLMVTFIAGIAVLVKISMPLNRYRLIIVLISAAIFLAIYFAAPGFLGVTPLSNTGTLFLICAAAGMPILLAPVNRLFNYIFKVRAHK